MARRRKPPSDLLRGPRLADRVIGAYPLPVALPYRKFDDALQAGSAAGAFNCLVSTFEALLHFLALVTLAAYIRSGTAHADTDRLVLDLVAKGKLALGELWQLLRDTLRAAGDCGGRLPYAELPGHFFRGKRRTPTDSFRDLERFLTLRNRDWAHAADRSDEALARRLDEHRPWLELELARCHWLTTCELVRPLRVEAGRVAGASRLMGERIRRDDDYDLPLEGPDLDDGLVRPQTSVLLVRPDRAGYLPLFPLLLFGVQPHGRQGVFLLQRWQWLSDRPRRLQGSWHVAYEAGLEVHEERGGDAAAACLERLAGRLDGRTGPAAPTLPAAAEDPVLDWTAVRQEQEGHLRGFVGRQDELRQIQAWIDARAGGGYLLLLGPPGQGKSALMAELARREDEPGRGGCLLHMIKSLTDPLRFVPLLLGQAAGLARTPFGANAYRGDLQQLRGALLRALEAVVGRTGRAVLLIDALDELVRVWDAVSGAERLCLRGDAGEVSGVAFAADGRTLASGSHPGTVRRWDAGSGTCLEVISGTTDVQAVTGGKARPLCRAVARGLETVLEVTATRQAIAWFPLALEQVALHACGRTWAGGARGYVCLFTLEGELPSP
jgi:hypothetical protein